MAAGANVGKPAGRPGAIGTAQVQPRIQGNNFHAQDPEGPKASGIIDNAVARVMGLIERTQSVHHALSCNMDRVLGGEPYGTIDLGEGAAGSLNALHLRLSELERALEILDETSRRAAQL